MSNHNTHIGITILLKAGYFLLSCLGMGMELCFQEINKDNTLSEKKNTVYESSLVQFPVPTWWLVTICGPGSRGSEEYGCTHTQGGKTLYTPISVKELQCEYHSGVSGVLSI